MQRKEGGIEPQNGDIIFWSYDVELIVHYAFHI